MDILDINEKSKTIKIEMGLGRGWQDDRIEVHPVSNEPPWVGFYYKILPIWFPTEKRRHARNMDEEREETIIGQNDSAGAWVLTYSEIYLDLHCDFKFAKFPMDTQYCPFIFTNENSGDLQLLPLANDTLGELQPSLSLDKEKASFHRHGHISVNTTILCIYRFYFLPELPELLLKLLFVPPGKVDDLSRLLSCM